MENETIILKVYESHPAKVPLLYEY